MVYRQFCKNEDVKDSPVDIGAVIRFYDEAMEDLPDAARLKALRTAGPGGVIDGKGERFADLSESNRRIWVPLQNIPLHVQKAFVAAEDKRFYEHRGVDERGLIRAMISNLAKQGRPQGGSTITQQVVKNLLVGDDVTYERKLREVILASRVEHTLSKSDILETYLNTIYLGRGAYGIELAARSYFGKPASALTLAEGAMLAALPKGPTYYSPDRHPDRTKDRLAYVISRMQEDGTPGADAVDVARTGLPHMVAYDRVAARTSGYYFLDQIAREARTAAGFPNIATAGITLHTTIRPDIQKAAETALQEGLAQYEMRTGRVEWRGAEANIGDAVRKAEAAGGPKGKSWQQALAAVRMPLYDVHWDTAVILGSDKNGVKAGLKDGRVVNLSAPARRGINTYDVVFVKQTEAKGKNGGGRVELRVRPRVQGAAIVLDNKTGAILSMVGGFSYPASQLNRTTQSQRQPGSSIKPFTYLAALRAGLQPNTLVRDQQVTLPPIGGNVYNAREKDYWTPKNDEGYGGGISTLRRGLENSKNLVTANLLDGGIDRDPSQSLARVCELALDAKIYSQCVSYYPFVLGAQPARLIDMAAALCRHRHRGPAAVALRHRIDRAGRAYGLYPQARIQLARRRRPARVLPAAHHAAGRGGARHGASNRPALALCRRQDRHQRRRERRLVRRLHQRRHDRRLGRLRQQEASGARSGGGQTGGQVAVPIFEQIVQATWSMYAKQTPLAPPSPEAKKELVAIPIDLAQRQPHHRPPPARPSPNGSGCATARSPTPSTTWSRSTRWRRPTENYSAGGYADGGDGGYPLWRRSQLLSAQAAAIPSRASSACSPRSRTTRRSATADLPTGARQQQVPQRLHLSWSAALVITLCGGHAAPKGLHCA